MGATVSARPPDDLLEWMNQQPEHTFNELIITALYCLKEQRSNGRTHDVASPAPIDPSALAEALKVALKDVAPSLGKEIGRALAKELGGMTFPVPLNDHGNGSEPGDDPALDHAVSEFLNTFGR